MGVSIGIIGRFISHFISGIVFFASFAPEGMNPALYSAIYNGSYLIVEFIITVIIIYFLLKRKILTIL
ncbi:MAG: energy-coupled thiamine transporter ThiT [Candidatus Bathyarchaeia archaeon]